MGPCRLERGFGLGEPASEHVQLPGEPQRSTARLRAAALLCQEERLLDEGRGPVKLEASEVHACQLVGCLALEVLAAGLAGKLERLEHDLFFLGQVAAHPSD